MSENKYFAMADIEFVGHGSGSGQFALDYCGALKELRTIIDNLLDFEINKRENPEKSEEYGLKISPLISLKATIKEAS